MHIYHYLRGFPATDEPLNAGMEKAVGGLAGGIAACGVESTVLCEAMKPDQTFTRASDGVSVRSFDHHATEHKRFGMPESLERFVREELAPAREQSLVILNAIFHPTVHLLSRLFRKHRITYLAAPHDPYHPAIFSGSLKSRLMKQAWWYAIEKPMLTHARAVQVLDARHGQLLRDRGVNTEVIEVVNGYSPEDVVDESKLVWRTSGPIRLLFLGRIDRLNKGLDLLIDAISSIAKSHPDLQLTLQGADRGDGPALQAMIDGHQLSGQIKIIPPDFNRRPGDLAVQHDLFVMPSRFEGFGLSAMEAMLAARPVLITDVAGLAPHLRKCGGGVVVESTVESIRAGLHQLIAQRDQWQVMGSRGRDYVREQLDWKSIAARTIPRYQEFLARPR